MSKARTVAVGFAALASAGVIGGVTALSLAAHPAPEQSPQQVSNVQTVDDPTTAVAVEPAPVEVAPTAAPTASPTTAKPPKTTTKSGTTSKSGAKTVNEDPAPVETGTSAAGQGHNNGGEGTVDNGPYPTRTADPQDIPKLPGEPGYTPPAG